MNTKFGYVARCEDGQINTTCSYGAMIKDVALVLLRGQLSSTANIQFAVEEAFAAVRNSSDDYIKDEFKRMHDVNTVCCDILEMVEINHINMFK